MLTHLQWATTLTKINEQQIILQSDGWTVITADNSYAAHYENTILITDNEPEILTATDF